MRSLRFRLALWFSLAVTLTAGTTAWVGYIVTERQVIEGLDFLLAAEVQEVAHRLGDIAGAPTSAFSENIMEDHAEIDAPLYFFQIRRGADQIVFRSKNLGDTMLPDLSKSTGAKESHGALAGTVALHGGRIRILAQEVSGFRVEVATSLDQTEDLLNRFTHALLLMVPLLFVGSSIAGWVLATLALRPVRVIHETARRISARNLSERIPVPAGGDEIAALARLLNDLFARLERSFTQVKHFTADASHELKTPLSLIRLHAERLMQSTRLDAAEKTLVEGQIEEIERLHKLIENLLLLAKADARSLRLDKRRLSTAAYLAEFAEDAVALAEDRGRAFVFGDNDDGTAMFDPVMLRQVFLNIVVNALNHTPVGDRVVFESRVDSSHWIVTIDDNGPGVPVEFLERIFARFERGPLADARVPGGSGLGLAIARSITEAHGGSVTALNRAAGGLRVVVILPASTVAVSHSPTA